MSAPSPASTDDGVDPHEYEGLAQSDPVWWVRSHIGGNPWHAQRRILESVRDNPVTAVASCHGAGKSHNAAELILWFLFTHCPSIVISTAPTARQVKGILWKYIGSMHAKHRRLLGGTCLTQDLKVDRDWYAMGFTAPDYDPDRFQGFHEEDILVVVDEACGVSEQIFNGIDGVLSSAHARLLMIGNPTDPDTEFGRACKREGVSKIHISAFDTPNFTQPGITEEDIASGAWLEKAEAHPLPFPKLVTPHWVADKYTKWGRDNPLYVARVLGRFPETSEDSLIHWRWIEAAQRRTLPAVGEETIGVDVARFGTDSTVLTHRKGPVLRRIVKRGQIDTAETTGIVRYELGKRPGARAQVDEIGVGAGVIDALVSTGHNAIGVNVGEAAHDSEHFANRRAEEFWRLRELFESGEIDIDPDDEDLAADLVSIKWKVTPAGKIQIEGKDDMKKRIGRSPDDADAAMLSVASRRQIGASPEDLYGSGGLLADMLGAPKSVPGSLRAVNRVD